METEYHSIKEVSKKLGVTYLTVYRWVQLGKLPAYKVEKQYRIKTTDLNSFIKSYKIK